MTTRIPKPAKILGLLGLLPFLIALFSAISIDLQLSLETNLKINVSKLQAIYSTIILCFMSGTYWGFAANTKKQSFLPYTISILPTFYVLSLHLYLAQYLIPLIAFGFVLLVPIDIYFSKSKMAPEWWLRLRIPLSILVFGILILYNFI